MPKASFIRPDPNRLVYPLRGNIQFMALRFRVSIRQAQEELGCRLQFDLRQAMKVVGPQLQWAGFAPR